MEKVLPRVSKLRETALDLLFPQKCVECGKEGSFICASCHHNLPFIMPPVCPLCGRPQASGLLCPGCIGWNAEIDGIRSPFRFDGVIKQAIYQLKYRNIRAIAPILAGFLAEYIQRYPVPGHILVPVPLHKDRIRERGYNQSSLLASELGKLCGLPVDDRTLIKIHSSAPQAKTSNVEERKTNVAGAFIARNDGLRDRQIILIDDVSTSGATFDACASILKESGAKSVWGISLAREI